MCAILDAEVSIKPPRSTRAAVLPDGSQRYTLGDEIARGGMGIVFRATDTVLGREVAVKVLHEKYTSKSGAASRFYGEASIAGQLQHPSIPPVHDLGALPDGRPFLAMKLIKGQTLEYLLKARHDPSVERGRFVAVFELICQALAYAHAHNVIHRDLKPANVMVGAFGEVQVMDWGLAKLLSSEGRKSHDSDPETANTIAQAWTQINPTPDLGSQTQAGSMLGTPAYAPPEQVAGELEKVDTRADVFGLGAILAVLLTGKPPYIGDSTESVRVLALRGKLDDCFSRLDACGAEPDLVALCKHCLAFEPADRPAHAGVLAQAVAAFRVAADERARRADLERVRVEGEQATAAARALERRKRRRLGQGAAAALALVALGGLAAVLVVQHRANVDLAAKNLAERQAKEQAQRRLAQIEKGVELFAGLLRGVNPRNEELGGPPLYEQLRQRAIKAADELVGEAVGDPEAVARIQTLLGHSLYELGAPDDAVVVLERARATQQALLGADDPRTLDTMDTLAVAYLKAGKQPEAIALGEQVRDARVKHLGAEHLETLSTLDNLAQA
jgi:hypothetical protein